MNDPSSFIHQIFRHEKLSERETAFIESKFQCFDFKKGAIIFEVGEEVHFQYFVHEGCLRSIYRNSKGKDYTIQFAIEDWWISDYSAYFAKEKASLCLESVLNSKVYAISKEDLDDIYLKVPQIETYFRKKMENAFIAFQKRLSGKLGDSATNRYLNFMETYPSIEQKVKNYHIASYLGITNESLSRIRKEIAKA